MRSFISTAAIVMVASFIQFEGVSIVAACAAQDRVERHHCRRAQGAWRRRQGRRPQDPDR